MNKHECPKCNKELPVTSEYFHVNNARKIGFQSTCKECTNKHNREKLRKERKEQKRIKKMNNGKPIKAKSRKEFKIGNKYKVSQGNIKRAGEPNFSFKGTAIYEDGRLLTLENKRNIRETFIKTDFRIGDYKISSM